MSRTRLVLDVVVIVAKSQQVRTSLFSRTPGVPCGGEHLSATAATIPTDDVREYRSWLHNRLDGHALSSVPLDGMRPSSSELLARRARQKHHSALHEGRAICIPDGL